MKTEIYRHSIAHPPQFEPAHYEHFEIEPLTGALGAEVHGLSVTEAFDDEAMQREIRQALTQHLVLMFRGQDLERDDLRRFGRLFGPLQVNPVVKKHETNDVMLVRQEAHEHYNFAGNWHSDVTWDPQPSGETALYAVDIPPCGGDTHFANTALAYETLSGDLKQMLRPLSAVHALANSQREFAAKKQDDADMDGDAALDRFTEHPVVRRHPVTGQESLYVNEQFTTRFVGMTEEESQPLLATLFQHQVRPDFTCRVRWRKGTLAVWDNRSTIHYASNDYPNIRRVMMRVSTVGETPLAPQTS